jgi:hypothetical protein
VCDWLVAPEACVVIRAVEGQGERQDLLCLCVYVCVCVCMYSIERPVCVYVCMYFV